ncbi:MAG: hypothetical protein NZ822_02420, partial [Patescibacteria group bacterium]|nr:hypothetical protein [Patescibacteria group bacterium]
LRQAESTQLQQTKSKGEEKRTEQTNILVDSLEERKEELIREIEVDSDFKFVFSMNMVIKNLIRKHRIVYEIVSVGEDNIFQKIADEFLKFYVEEDDPPEIREHYKLDVSEFSYDIHPFGITIILEPPHRLFAEREALGFHTLGSPFEVVERRSRRQIPLEDVILHERTHNILDPYLSFPRYPYEFLANFGMEIERCLNGLLSKIYQREYTNRLSRIFNRIKRLTHNPFILIDHLQLEFLADMLVFEKRVDELLMKGEYARSIFSRLSSILHMTSISDLKELQFREMMKLDTTIISIINFWRELRGAKNDLLNLFSVKIGEKFSEEDKELLLTPEQIEEILRKDEPEIELAINTLFESKGIKKDASLLTSAFINLKPLYEVIASEKFSRSLEMIRRGIKDIFYLKIKAIFFAHFLGMTDDLHALNFVLPPSKVRHILRYFEDRADPEMWQLAESLFNLFVEFDFSLTNLRKIEGSKDKIDEREARLIAFMFNKFVEEIWDVSRIIDIQNMSLEEIREYLMILRSLNEKLNFFSNDSMDEFYRLLLHGKFMDFIADEMRNQFTNLRSLVERLSPEELEIFKNELANYFEYNYDELIKYYGEEKICGEEGKIDLDKIQSLPFWQKLEEVGLDGVAKEAISNISY